MSAAALSPESFTARRLEHATPDHLHVTTRRTFIGPIPDGWLKHHRRQWYRKYLPRHRKRTPSFRAANEEATGSRVAGVNSSQTNNLNDSRDFLEPRPSSQSATPSALANSTSSLLHNQHRQASVEEHSNHGKDTHTVDQSSVGPSAVAAEPSAPMSKPPGRLAAAKVHFSEPTRLQLRARAQRLASKGNLRNSKVKDGEVLKMDRMLVRIDITQQSLGPDFDEKVSLGVETKTMDKWREFMIVCRKRTEGDARSVLQLYQTRVIAASVSDPNKAKKKPKASILLSPARTWVNLYSSLDKSLCLWTYENLRTTIYFLRPQTGASSVEWFTFLSDALGFKRSQTLQVNVPDLRVTLRLDNPFESGEAAQNLIEAAEGDDDALLRAVNDEKGAAGAIVTRCVDMLKESPEWTDVIRAWAEYGRIGLAWKRYDRLEWVHGAVEQRMYGTIAMSRTHELELRPKQHYPVTTTTPKGKTLEEPSPVEGFLIRLTAQQGQERRMGKMLFKRLYFTTQDQYLLFVRPAKAVPPCPPHLATRGSENVPATSDSVEEVPLTYEVEPYPLRDRQIAWLDPDCTESYPDREVLDDSAASEAERNTDLLLACDGFINLCDVKKVRKYHKGAMSADENVDDGSDVEFDFDEDDNEASANVHDGSTNQIDEDRVFELVMSNGLVVRLQAYSKAARKQWMIRLRKLKKYWSHRAHTDMMLLKNVREQNLKTLQVDERAEAMIGSFAYKWEVGHSYASSTVYNMCGIAECRTIHMSGPLFRKPRRHTTFNRCHVILAHGHLLIFQETLRRRTGHKVPHIYNERIASISLDGCYMYSGLLTEKELLYQNQTFDANLPGNHALPRVYLEDSWTSTDEDSMTTFVIWHAKSKSWFRSSHNVDDVRQQETQQARDQRKGRKTKLTRVSQLGATGRSVVFKARSRAERDQWVIAIQVEIERLTAENQAKSGDDIRITHEQND